MTGLIELEAGFATIGQGAGPMMVTWKADLFLKHGLDIGRPRIMGGAKGVVRGLMAGEIQFGNMAAPAPLRANLKGEADLVFLTGGINQQFILGRPGIDRREELAGKKIGFVGDGGLNDALVKFIIAKLNAAGIAGLREETVPAGGDKELEALLSGKCDAIVSTPPESIEAHRHGCQLPDRFFRVRFELRSRRHRRPARLRRAKSADHAAIYQSLCRRDASLSHRPGIYRRRTGGIQRHRRPHGGGRNL